VDCGALLWQFQNQDLFEILGTGYYHPVLPLTPESDRPLHLKRWLDMARHLFWRPAFQGFWPPEMGFSMELIPLLRAHGYRYVLVDSEHVKPITPMKWHELRYRPHVARYQGAEILVIVRDRDLSNAQESGMELDWFLKEVEERTRWCDFPPLVTTCTDGENGGWFRNTTPGANFWSAFYLPLLERVRAGRSPVAPTFISNYLNAYGPMGEVSVETGAWNTGWHDGRDFIQWTGSDTQKASLEALPSRTAPWMPPAPGSGTWVSARTKPWRATWRRPPGACCAPRRVVISTGARPGWAGPRRIWRSPARPWSASGNACPSRPPARLPPSSPPRRIPMPLEPDALAGAPDSPAAAAPSDPTPPSSTPTEGCQP
jgi:hypothetical protein